MLDFLLFGGSLVLWAFACVTQQILASVLRTCWQQAANWIFVGQTAGRGRMDRDHAAHGQAVKDIYVYPLKRDVRQQLCRN